MDEMRVGQKGRLCHRWWARGKRPPGVQDQRHEWAYLFGAARPGGEAAFALVLPTVKALAVPPNVTLVPLPPYSPQLNPMERLWLYLRERFLSLRVLEGYEAIVDACCIAWNAIADDADRIRSLCLYPYIQKVIG